MTPLLTLEDVTASYGPAQALFGVSLDIAEGEILALMGRNGMGKTTTIRTITGMLTATGGTVAFAGQSLHDSPSHRRARAGIGLVPEGRRCFPNLTVEENLRVAARPGHWTTRTVTDLFPRLEERRRQLAVSLSGGEQQMLAIGRALMTNPRLLLLDEATEGLAPVVRQEIWAAIDELADAGGFAILIVDKSLSELRIIAKRAVILDRGRSVWHGELDQLTQDDAHRLLGV
jgi:branched-chain amino acid transport system ATP-binding protein